MRLRTSDPRGLRVLHIGGYWRGPNDIVRHMMLGLRAAGAEVEEYNTDEHSSALDTEGRCYDRGTTGPVWLISDKLRRPIEEFAPELIVCNAGGLSFRPQIAQGLPASYILARDRPVRPRRIQADHLLHRPQFRSLPDECTLLRTPIRGAWHPRRGSSSRHQRGILSSCARPP